jgi:hypothetical protein
MNPGPPICLMILGCLLGAFPAAGGAEPLPLAAEVLARAQAGRPDAPRLELAAALKAAGLEATLDYAIMRDNAARELKGRPDGAGPVSAEERQDAERAIERQIAILQRAARPPRTLSEVAKLPGRPQLQGVKLVYLTPLGDPADANKWQNILAHQTEGPAGSARTSAVAQAANPTKRGVTIWVETDGTAYWATSERAIPTHGDGANRNDNKYIDNSKTYHAVVKTSTIGVEFIGNYPDVTKPVTSAQMEAWLVLVTFLQERYGIAAERIYAHNWIDYKDSRYCEGCELATQARRLGYVPTALRGAQ